jgi:hypothetical protein
VTADPAGAGLEVFGQLSAQIGSLTGEMRAQRSAQQAKAGKIWPVNVQAPQWNGTGTYDPGVFGPADGWAWAIHRITAATFTAGTVNMYKGQPADNNQLFAFLQAGANWFARTSFILMPKDRLTFAAAAGSPITGPVTISLDATQVALELLPDFLL